MKRGLGVLGLAIVFLSACTSSQEGLGSRAFQLVSSDTSGVTFLNQLTYDEHLNTYTYRNFYNGAGVAVGDIDNDGLMDIYFAGNQVDNKLFRNLGNFRFEDITKQAGVACRDVWSTGVSFADVNNDGYLDLYVCKAGPQGGVNRHNELFINNGDLTFSEQSEEWEVADEGLSLHAAFFDYDKDGDQDFYLLNNSLRSVGIYDLREGQRENADTLGGNKLYRNEGDHFVNVALEAGIYTSSIGFGLGVTIGDLDRDGWQDIFVSNDFFERDYLYLNQQDGTFREALEDVITETSMGSMGADIADINNDGYPEIYVTEMLPATQERYKTKTLFEGWDKYQAGLQSGYYEQFTRNTLQLNLGEVPNDHALSFSEISRQTGLHATDWSWGALVFDYDNDGLKDIFVANGIAKDLTDIDYINFYANSQEFIRKYREDSLVLTKLIDQIPSVPLPNQFFRNHGDLTFEEMSAELGLADSSFSNGAAYADFDNDGDLDLVVNNINQPSFLYRNNTPGAGNYVMLDLRNVFDGIATGAQATVYADSLSLFQELVPVKGYLSSIDHRLHFGLGGLEAIDSLRILWPNGVTSRHMDLPANQILKLVEPPKTSISPVDVRSQALFAEAPPLLDFEHSENAFTDFNRDRLLVEMHSNEGPKAARGDVNGDGLEDLFLCGAKGQSGQLFLQNPRGQFTSSLQSAFEAHAGSEDLDAAFFDCDGDGDQDLIVASGGNEFGLGDPALRDRMYMNDGGQYRYESNALPRLSESSSLVQPMDYDNDGDLDLLIGTRLRPFQYGIPASSFLLENDGSGHFTDRTAELAPSLLDVGMVTGGTALDYDQDGDMDIALVGKWMPVTLLRNDNGTFSNQTTSAGLANSHGLWNSIERLDLDGDGFEDLVAGNIGLNTRYRASDTQPITMYVHDFDRNGSIEQITCQFEGEESYPIHMLADLTKQLPSLRKRFLRAQDFQGKTMNELFTPEEMEGTIILQASTLSSAVFFNDQSGRFRHVPLPSEAQRSPIYAITSGDFNDDGHKDLLVGGNFTRSKPEWGIYKASYGQLLLGQGAGNLEAPPMSESGFFVRGEIRDLLNFADIHKVLVIRNNSTTVTFQYGAINN